MIHSMSGGVITRYDVLLYAFVEIYSGVEAGVKRWYVSPFPLVKAGDKVVVPASGGSAEGKVLRVERVTAQTAPFPINRTKEIERVQA